MGKAMWKFILLVCWVILLGHSPTTYCVRINDDQIKQLEDRFNHIENRLDRETRESQESQTAIMDKLIELGEILQHKRGSAEPSQNAGHGPQGTLDNDLGMDKRSTDVLEEYKQETLNQWRVRREADNDKQSNTDFVQGFSDLVDDIQECIKSSRSLEPRITDIERFNREILRSIDLLGQAIRDFKNYNVASTTAIVARLDDMDVCVKDSDEMSTINTTRCNHPGPRYHSCVELQQNNYTTSGLYDVYPTNSSTPIKVYCDQVTDGGGWIIFQRRADGSEIFYRGWNDYEVGFGNLEGEFWLGNENLHLLAGSCCHELRIDLEDFDGEHRYAKYSNFSIGSKESNYTLTIDGYTGDTRDSMSYHNGMAFTTHDADHDNLEDGNCAVNYGGPWWYKRCFHSNLNGQYLREQHESYTHGVFWSDYDWEGSYYSLKKTEMKFR